MKLFKKAASLILCLVMILSAFAIPTSAAAVTAPEIKVALTSETSSQAVFQISITKGKISALDLTIKYSGVLSSVTSITATSELKEIRDNIQSAGDGGALLFLGNIDTAQMTLASTKSFGSTSLFNVTMKKASSTAVKKSNFVLTVDNCVYSDASGNNNDLTSSTTVVYAFSKFSFNEDTVSINYKSSVKLGYETSVTASNIVWSSSKENIATVDENGVVTALKKGTTVITAKAKDGSWEETCTVKVTYTALQWVIMYLLFGFLWY